MLNNSQKFKILHIITNLPVGGAQDNTLITAERMDPARFEVSLLAAKRGDWVTRVRDMRHVKFYQVNTLTRTADPINDLISLLKIYKIIKKNRYHLVHTHTAKAGFLGRLAAKLAGVPVIIHTYHGFPFNDFMAKPVRKFYILLERVLGLMSNCLITVSTLNWHRAHNLKLAPSKKLVTIYSGIDFSKLNVKINLEQKKTVLEIPPDKKIVGWIGRFMEQKDPQNYLEAAVRVAATRDDLVFLMIGDGPLKSAIIDLSKKLAINSRVKYFSFRDDIHEVMQLFDIYVLSSRWEGLGRSLTEALYLARPTVATNVEGVPELVINEKTGLLVPPADPAALAKAILYLLDNPVLARAMGQKAHHLVAQNFDAGQMVKKLQELFVQHLNGKIYKCNQHH